MRYGKTITEKIFSMKAGKDLRAGDFAFVEVDYGMTHDVNAPSVFSMFQKLNGHKVKESQKFALFLDHISPAHTTAIANAHNKMIEFAKNNGIEVHMPGEGVCHQLVLESGKIMPGSIAVGTDSHTCTYGIFNALGISIGASEMAVALANSECWFKVPQSIKVTLTGALTGYASAKDVSLELLRLLGENGAVYQCVEFCGDGLETLSMESRAVLTNMASEMGAKTTAMAPDRRLADFLGGSAAERLVYPDDDAQYRREITIDLSEIEPLVAVPPDISNVAPVGSLNRLPVSQVVIGSCTNGRFEDFEIAAKIIAGHKLADGLKLIISPASKEIYLKMIESGVLKTLVEAGALVNAPGCGPCAGLSGGLAGDGDTVVSTTNRCLKGRMGSRKADIYLASPATAAFSAIHGIICCGRDN